MPLNKDMEFKVRRALWQYSEYQVANMYGLRIGTVRAIKMQMQDERQARLDSPTNESQLDLYRQLTATGRKQETPLEMGVRLHEDLFKHQGTVTGRCYHTKPKDFVGLEGRVMAGFFTPNGLPTPAFWGFISQYVKKSGHTMLDILHDKEIYSPEQLERALDIDSQIQDMTQAQRIALLRRLTNAVYSDEFKDPTDPGSDVQDSE